MTRREFEAALKEALDGLPKYYRTKLDNIEFVVKEEPTPEELRSLGVRGLYGLYQGIPLGKRGTSYHGTLPDQITIFQLPLEAASCTHEELLQNLRKTLLHEIGHYFGIGDAELRKMGY